jgi:hypothetical protein
MLHAVVDSEFESLVEVFPQSNGKLRFEIWMIHIMDGCIDYALAQPRIFDYVFSMPRAGAAFPLRLSRAALTNAKHGGRYDVVADEARQAQARRCGGRSPWDCGLRLTAISHFGGQAAFVGRMTNFENRYSAHFGGCSMDFPDHRAPHAALLLSAVMLTAGAY